MRHPTGDFIEYFESLVAAQGLERGHADYDGMRHDFNS
jgi:hypothetical protein